MGNFAVVFARPPPESEGVVLFDVLGGIKMAWVGSLSGSYVVAIPRASLGPRFSR